MEANDACFCEESFINRAFLVLEILRGEKVGGGGWHFVNWVNS